MIRLPRWLPDAATFALLAVFVGAIFLAPAEGQTEEAPLPDPLLELILRETPPEPAQTMSAAIAPRAAGIPGVGYPGGPPVPPNFVSNWCAQLRPPFDWPNACSQNPARVADIQAAGWNCAALCPRTGWQGYFAEFFPLTEMMLRGCWELDRWGTRNTHTGSYAPVELQRAMVFQPQRSEEYRLCWYERFAAGGSPELAFVIDSDAAVRSYRNLIDQAKAQKAWKPGLFSFRWNALTAWPSWVDNALPLDHPENRAAVPPPPPVPVPPPPPPPPGPACTSWPISAWLEQCGKLATKSRKDLAGVELCSWCERKNPDPKTVLARLRALVCEPVICEASPPPPPSCKECEEGRYTDPRCKPCPCPPGLTDPTGVHVRPGAFCAPLPGLKECQAGDYTDPECFAHPCPPELIDSSGHRRVKGGHFCNPVGVEPSPVRTCIVFEVAPGQKITLPKYVPGIESTGRLELVLVPQGEGPCP